MVLTSSESSMVAITDRPLATKLISLVELIGPWFVLALLLRFTVGLFAEAPYAGFRYTPTGGEIVELYDGPQDEGSLEVGDRLLQVGSVAWADFEDSYTLRLFADAQPGDVVNLRVQRGEEQLSIPWTFPGPTFSERLHRLNSEWWLPYVFWVAGVATLLLIRPKEIRWRLLIAFNFLTAIWLAAGGVTAWHVGHSKYIFRTAIWLAVPVYLHLHWMFPAPLGPSPRWLLWPIYAGAVVAAAAEWWRLLPADAYQLAFLVAVAGSAGLLAWRLLFRPQQRRAVGLLGGAVLLLFVPLLAVGVLSSLGYDLTFLGGGALLAFPAVPGAYFYMLFRRQLGRRQARARRLIRLYLAMILLSVLLITALAGAGMSFGIANSPLFLQTGVLVLFAVIALLSLAPFLSLAALSDASPSTQDTFLAGLTLRANRLLAPFLFLVLATPIIGGFILLLHGWSNRSPMLPVLGVVFALGLGVAGYRPWRRWVDRYLLGIRLPHDKLLESFTDRIITCLDRPSLVRLFRDEVLPSLLVRESMLVYMPDRRETTTIFAVGVGEESPSPEQCDALPERATRVAGGDARTMPSWVRLAVPLRLGEQIVGCWLCGRRDPDDWYSDAELPIFQALANQTAVALTNIVQANRLRALYQENIDRTESERMRLARSLHDEILNQLTVLAMHADDSENYRQFQEAYGTLTTRLREIIAGLRPALLPYGLRATLEEFVDELSGRPGTTTSILLDLPAVNTRYPSKVEQHLFRIVQQAVENALEHAAAETIWIGGRLDPGVVELTIEDDGRGFPADQQFELDNLLAHKHFGLAGMYERAALIEAELHIDASPGNGTRLSIFWAADDDEPPEPTS